ncbi:unnamed protein product [Kuraishia capsulata CBS 1993]|uniref:Actin-like protein ARP6 n=1 Tax=Kuraishia capsulata CBS 1993 TaxID=1382522 RepID=W6MIJ3_9ASCO|nr:uncharacterized protein KUCA_T00000137001 [Kuraishia capsulata CBS 1993]CDK24177.1 unnamed protein product [Kuraishia capsulata CBS 1993]
MAHNLVIDNGSYEIKIGTTAMAAPIKVQNAIIRTRDKRILQGDQISTLSELSGIVFRRPIEKGQLTAWSIEKPIWDSSFITVRAQVPEFEISDSNLILTEAPYTLKQLSQQTDQMVFEEFGVQSYYRCIPQSLVPWNDDNQKLLGGPQSMKKEMDDFQLVIDSGFECTWVVPMVHGVPLWNSIRKLPIGGRFLNGVLRELISFRYYDVTDETVLVNNIKESTCFLSSDFNESLSKIHELKNLKRSSPKFDSLNKDNLVVDYVLPDYKTTATGYVLEKGQPQDDLQILTLYDERFSVPEVLFYPEIVRLETKAGLVKTILDSLNSCPELIRPLLTANMVLVGGTAKLPNYKERLYSELRSVLRQDYTIRICQSDETYVWHSGVDLFDKSFEKGRVTKQEYEEHGMNIIRKKFKTS